jgi:hypothetical protein
MYTVELGKQEELLDLSHLSTDGSKIKANASNERVLTGDELEFLLRFVDEELEEWARQDTKEDDLLVISGDLISCLAKARRRFRKRHNITSGN